MKLLKIVAISMFLFFTLEGCKDSTQELEKEVSKGDILEAIQSYKETMYVLGASDGTPSTGQRMYSTSELEMISKDRLVDSHIRGGFDSEWLDMAVLVLNFAEALTASEYVVGEESLFYDFLNDPSIWGWKVYENTRVILSYQDEVLYLRVIDDNLIQTFFFEYTKEGLIKIFRLWENIWPDGSHRLYLEDFIENTGLATWKNSGEYGSNSSVKLSDGGNYTIGTNRDNDSYFVGATFLIGDVPVRVYQKTNGTFVVDYDLKFIDVYDSFNEDGALFMNNEEVLMPLAIDVRPSYFGSDKYFMIGSKELIGETSSLSVQEANVNSSITDQSIIIQINALLRNFKPNKLSYDYSRDVADILNELKDILYLTYD